MSKKVKQNTESEMPELAVEEASKTTAAEADVESASEEVTKACDENTEEAAPKTEDTAENSAESKVTDQQENSEEDDSAVCEETAEFECVGKNGKHFRFVANVVKKIKEKTSKLANDCSEDDKISETVIDDALKDEIILDDDIIAELQEYERKEKLKKKIAIYAAGAAAGVMLTLFIKSRKNKK